jgi:hypothetical protein
MGKFIINETEEMPELRFGDEDDGLYIMERYNIIPSKNQRKSCKTLVILTDATFGSRIEYHRKRHRRQSQRVHGRYNGMGRP